MSIDPALIRWERRKKGGGAPPGPRCGCTTVHHKGFGVLFGGVSDIKEEDETIESVCHGDLMQYKIDSNKWYPMTMRKHPSTNENVPSPRFNAMMSVSQNTLYIYGGVFEKGDIELTLNDLWSLNLDKLDGWKCLIADQNLDKSWMAADSSSEEESSDEEPGTDEEKELGMSEISTEIEQDEQQAYKQNEHLHNDTVPNPSPGETLKDYFIRTQVNWQEFVQKEFDSDLTGKALRKDAFAEAEKRFVIFLPENERIAKTMQENDVQIMLPKAKEQSEPASSRYKR